jgi:phage terminase large subunit-like protein
MAVAERVVRIPYGLGVNEKQDAFHKLVEREGGPGHEIQITFFKGGVGSGKTFAGAHETLRQAFKYPGVVILVAAPTYRMLARATRKTLIDVCPPSLIRDFRQSKNELVLVNGSIVWFCSTDDPEHNRGTSVDRLWIDEPGQMIKSAYDILIARLRGSRPEFGVHLPAWLTGTPKAGTRWLREEFERGKPNRARVTVKTIENPHLPPGYVNFLRETYTGQYARQELEAEDVTFEGLIYPMLAEAIHYPVERQSREMVAFYGGQDWGFTNPGVAVVFGVDANGRKHFFEEFRASNLRISGWVDGWQGLCDRYPVKQIFCGPDQPANIAEYQTAGLPAIAATDDVTPGIETCLSAFALKDGLPGTTFSAAMAEAWVELVNYQWDRQRGDIEGSGFALKNRAEKPLKVNDHGPDAIRYGLHSRKTALGETPSFEVRSALEDEDDE